MTGLPLCPQTEIPRLLCDHCQSFSMTQDERMYLNGWEVYAPATSAPPVPRSLPEYVGGLWSEPRDVKIADSATICRTPGCTRPSGDSFVCAPCIDDLEVCLGNAPRLEEDLTLLIMRQARFGSGGGAGERAPLPYNPPASDRLAYLNSALVSAVRWLTEQRKLPKPQIEGVTAVSRWLLARVHAVAMDEGGGDIVAEIKREHDSAMRAIDRPKDRLFIGNCDECATPMHAPDDRATFVCRTCTTEYVVVDRIEQIRAKIRERLCTVGQLVQVCGSHYERVKVSRHQVNRLVAKGRLVRRGSIREGDALYLAGDLLDLIEESGVSA
jgi:hypothetical protein